MIDQNGEWRIEVARTIPGFLACRNGWIVVSSIRLEDEVQDWWSWVWLSLPFHHELIDNYWSHGHRWDFLGGEDRIRREESLNWALRNFIVGLEDATTEAEKRWSEKEGQNHENMMSQSQDSVSNVFHNPPKWWWFVSPKTLAKLFYSTFSFLLYILSHM